MQGSNAVALLVLFILISLNTNCTGPPPADVHEVDGIVSADPNLLELPENWVKLPFINSVGIRAGEDTDDPFRFTVSFTNPGNYSLWVLSAQNPGEDASEPLPVTITDSDNTLIGQLNAHPPEKNRLLWTLAESIDENDQFNIPESGVYTIRVGPDRARKIQVHKFFLTYANDVKPTGLGYPASTRTDLSAAELHREIPVMLPPAWVFGSTAGFTEPVQTSIKSFLRFEDIGTAALYGNEYLNSGIETLSDEEKEKIHIGESISVHEDCSVIRQEQDELRTDFGVVKQAADPACIDSIHKQIGDSMNAKQNTRTFAFRDISGEYLSEMKRFPAPSTKHYTAAWSADRNVDEASVYQPGGFHELTEDLSDPLNSLASTPFLSFPVDFSAFEENDEGDGFFQQLVQLMVFTPVMHFVNLPVESLTEENQGAFFDAVRLRSNLFPYHYTNAHYTRQTNETVIRGFRDHRNQYLYGDAFLIAPQTDPQADGRIIYFPDGRKWYAYNSRRQYEAGQSWFVETESGRLPVFVKAGSIIPYRPKPESKDLEIEIYTGDAGTFRLVEDDGESRDYRRTRAARTMFRYNEVSGQMKLTIGAVQANYEGMNDERSYMLRFLHSKPPSEVSINGNLLSEKNDGLSNYWEYSADKAELRVFLDDQNRFEKIDILISPE